jgi:hypothetical protein
MTLTERIEKQGSCILTCIRRAEISSGKGDTTPDDAKKEFDGLVAAAKIGEKMRWIPVSEGLPRVNETVFAVVDGVPYTGYLDVNNTWHILSTLSCRPEKRHITHWMPLPEPPREEG